MMLAREVGSSGYVLAVEPNPHNAAVAQKNRELNGMSQIEIAARLRYRIDPGQSCSITVSTGSWMTEPVRADGCRSRASRSMSSRSGTACRISS